MKIYIVTRRIDGESQNVIVTSSKKIADHLAKHFSYMDSYKVEEHELMGECMMDGD